LNSDRDRSRLIENRPRGAAAAIADRGGTGCGAQIGSFVPREHRPDVPADAIVTGTDMHQGPWGFAQTLREVLVRSSGDPRLSDPRTAPLAVHPDRFIVCFDYVDMMAAVPLDDDR
jgi:hypothetical protein